MQILVSIGTVGASPQIGEILPPCDFFDCPILFCPVLSLPFFLDPTPRSNRWTDFHALWLKRRVSVDGRFGVRTMGDHIWGNMPSKFPKMGVNRQFPVKTAKYKIHNISKTINRIKTKFEDQAETGNCTSWVV